MAVRVLASRVPGLARPVANVTSTLYSRYVIALALRDSHGVLPARLRAVEFGVPFIGGRSLSRVKSAMAATETTQEGRGDSKEDDGWQVKMLYDGECPLCMREVSFLRQRNETYRTLQFVDIASPEYSEEENAGISYEMAMGQIHGIMRDGRVVTGIEAFRTFYEVLGLGWVYYITKLPAIGAAADAVYDVWAKYRMSVTGRDSLDAIIAQRRREKEGYQQCGPTNE